MPRRLLAVWAHPDDEAFGPAGTMRMAHELGWETGLISATRGEAGANEGIQLAAGETLGDLRVRELTCAARVIGVSRTWVWDLPDGGLAKLPEGVLAERVAATLAEWRPEIVITFGPDGITGHPDHVAISAATRQAWERTLGLEATHEGFRLYYHTIRPEQSVEQRMGEAPPPLPPTAVLDVTAYEDYKRRALACHASQRGDWGPLLEDLDWLRTDRLARGYPAWDGAIETTILGRV